MINTLNVDTSHVFYGESFHQEPYATDADTQVEDRLDKAANDFKENYDLVDTLGEGGYGKVFHAKSKHSDEELAYKQMHAIRTAAGSEIDDRVSGILKEAYLYTGRRSGLDEPESKLKKDKLLTKGGEIKAKKVKSKDLLFLEDSNNFAMPHSEKEVQFASSPGLNNQINEIRLNLAMDVVKGVTFDQLLTIHSNKINFKDFVLIFYRALQAMSDMHSKGLIHGDINSNNIYLEDSGANITNAKLGDLGLALAATNREAGTTHFKDLGVGSYSGTPITADLAALSKGFLGTKSDLYSWAQTLLLAFDCSRANVVGEEQNKIYEHYVKHLKAGTDPDQACKDAFNDFINNNPRNLSNDEINFLKGLQETINAALDVNYDKRPDTETIKAKFEELMKQNGFADLVETKVELSDPNIKALWSQIHNVKQNEAIHNILEQEIIENGPQKLQKLIKKYAEKPAELMNWLDKLILRPSKAVSKYQILQAFRHQLIQENSAKDSDPQKNKKAIIEKSTYQAKLKAKDIVSSFEKIYLEKSQNNSLQFNEYFNYINDLNKYKEIKELEVALQNIDRLEQINQFIPGLVEIHGTEHKLLLNKLSWQVIELDPTKSSKESIQAALNHNLSVIKLLKEISRIDTKALRKEDIENIQKQLELKEVASSPYNKLCQITKINRKLKRNKLLADYKNVTAAIDKKIQKKDLEFFNAEDTLAMAISNSHGCQSLEQIGFSMITHNLMKNLFASKPGVPATELAKSVQNMTLKSGGKAQLDFNDIKLLRLLQHNLEILIKAEKQLSK